MDETVANAISLCEKYPKAKATGIRKKKTDKDIAFEAFGLTKEESHGK